MPRHGGHVPTVRLPSAGSPLRVVGIDGVTLDVEPLEGAARDYREMRKTTPPPTEIQ